MTFRFSFQGKENLLAIANEDGCLSIHDTNKSGKESLYVDFEAHNNAIFDVSWMPRSDKIITATASGDQSVRIFEILSSEDVKLLHTFKGYTRSVKCVEFAPENPNILATGSRENSILLWDLRESSETRPCLAIKGAHTHSVKADKKGQPSSGSITAIQYQDENHLVSSSDTDGIIKVWDLRRSFDRYKGNPQAQYSLPYPGKSALHGYSSMVMNSTRTHLYAACKDHHIYTFDLATYNEKSLRSFSGFENGCKFFIRMSLSCDDKYLACGSSDQYAYIWNTSPYGPSEPIYRLTGHESAVTCVEWSKAEWKLATCADDMMHRIWRIQPSTTTDPLYIHGRAEAMPNVQYPSKQDLKVTNFVIEKENLMKENSQPAAKKRRIRSPFTSLPTTPQKSQKLAQFPSKNIMSPQKKCYASSPRKIVLSPRKLFSPTANLPNFVMDGKSPHQPLSGKKKCRVDWLTSLRRQQKESSPKMSPKEPKKRESLKRKRAKKSLDLDEI